MYFEIDHVTRYRYSVPVELGEHLLRFRPMPRAGQRVAACRVAIDPGPWTREEGEDGWGNPAERVCFQGETGHLEIHAHLEVETREPATTASGGSLTLPLAPGLGGAALAPYLEPLEEAAALEPFVGPLLSAAGGEGLAFLDELSRAVHGFYHRGVRLDGPPRQPAETLSLGEGVCRDLSMLFMAVCRHVGLAARFVSGYQQGDGTREIRYLHAWAEVWLPAEGWVGYDPSHGTRVGSDHVAVAAAPRPEGATPVEGGLSFRGPRLDSTLETEIRITTYREPPALGPGVG